MAAPFKLKSQGSPFKQMGSSPVKQDKGFGRVPSWKPGETVEMPKPTHLIKEKNKAKPKKSYKDAYEGADKTKYPTFESFKKAAVEHNKDNPKKNNPKKKKEMLQEGLPPEKFREYLKKNKLDTKSM